MSCPQIGTFEYLVGVQENMGSRVAISRALSIVSSEFSSREINLIKDFDKAFVEIGER